MNVENPLISDFYRFGHLQKLQDKIQKIIQQLGNLEEDYLKGRMKQGLVLGIETVINKIPETELNKRAIDQMIMRPWQGGNFSDRVWKNKRLLANQLNDKLRNGIIQGKSPFQIANNLSERMQVGRYQAQRLVRTEYMHVLNQGQIEGYKAKGYTKLKWHASKDERTCEICGEHHGNEYEIDEAPHLPAHPGCRCTFVPVIDVESAAEELKQVDFRGTIKSNEPYILRHPDIQLPKSVSAKARDIYLKRDYPLINSDDNLKAGETIRFVNSIAGKGVRRKIDVIDWLMEKYPGAKASDWQKMTGIVKLESGDLAEVHWYQAPNIGKVEIKVKEKLNENKR